MKREKKYKPALWKQIADELTAKLGPKSPIEFVVRTKVRPAIRPTAKMAKAGHYDNKTGKTRKRVSPMSDKRKKERREYLKLKVRYLDENRHCQRLGCNAKATDLHHTRGRGKNYLRVDTFMALCHDCHDWAHNNIAAATQIGLFGPKGTWMS